MAAVKKQSEGLKREYDNLMKEYEQLQVGGSGSLYENNVLKLYQQNSASRGCYAGESTKFFSIA